MPSKHKCRASKTARHQYDPATATRPENSLKSQLPHQHHRTLRPAGFFQARSEAVAARSFYPYGSSSLRCGREVCPPAGFAQRTGGRGRPQEASPAVPARLSLPLLRDEQQHPSISSGMYASVVQEGEHNELSEDAGEANDADWDIHENQDEADDGDNGEVATLGKRVGKASLHRKRGSVFLGDEEEEDEQPPHRPKRAREDELEPVRCSIASRPAWSDAEWSAFVEDDQ
ncbi:hypothetical protein GTA08_BOTSDO10051 [Botryosphaeria dothidea]|uniref:Uncharacterized protein n=1 Tax=Botryosphaeria dothidea TaxID=55169 RepID=A0A8H4MXG8_9PEZI|nr:hypothetical protein GTA08_BOTSDO10051 [Botryosphaeria dothidea]